MKRLPDWRVRLAAAIDSIERTPLEMGTHDCALGLAAGVVEAVTGVDIGAPFKGRYSTVEGALKVLSDERATSLTDLVGRYLTAMPIGAMRLGDIAAVPDDGPFGCFLGVCNGERLVVLRADGKGTVDRRLATMAFRVGD